MPHKVEVQGWSNERPTVPGWFWWRDKAFVLSGREKPMEVTAEDLTVPWGDTCEWSGPIPIPTDAPAQGYYKAEEVEALEQDLREGLAVMVQELTQCPIELYQQWLDDDVDFNFYQWQAQRLLDRLRGGA